MKLSDIIKIAAVGALVYGAYKLGEKKGEKKSIPSQPEDNYEEAEIVEEKSEEDFIQDLINSLKSKPNKSPKDKNTLELLEIKLKQILKGK